eukprot:g21609.t1
MLPFADPRTNVNLQEKRHYHSSLGLTSLAYENLGGAGKLKGHGAASRGIPGYQGFIPGKVSENAFAETWSKTQDWEGALYVTEGREDSVRGEVFEFPHRCASCCTKAVDLDG